MWQWKLYSKYIMGMKLNAFTKSTFETYLPNASSTRTSS